MLMRGRIISGGRIAVLALACVLLATSVSGTEAIASARGGTTGKISLTPRDYIAGEKLQITGNVGVPGKRTVILQRFMRDKFLDEGTAKTDKKGNFAFAYPGPGMATPFSVYVPSLKKRTPQAPVSPQEQVITLGFNPVAGLLGLASKVRVTTFPVRAGRTLVLQRRTGGSSWESVASAPTDKAGVASFTVKPPTTGNVVYRAIAGAIKGRGVAVFPSFPTYHYVYKLPLPVSAVSSAVTAPDKTGAKVGLSWTTPDDEWIAEVVVGRVEGAPGTTPAPPQTPDAADVTQRLDGAAATLTDTKLTPGAAYAYTIFTLNGRGDQAQYVSEHSSTITTTPTQPVTGLSVTGEPTATSVTLGWTGPDDPTANGIVVVRAEGTTAPTSPDGGTQVGLLAKSATAFTDESATASTTYAYAVFVTNKFDTYSSPATVVATTPAEPPPEPPAESAHIKGWW